jgi:hypothetical protein
MQPLTQKILDIAFERLKTFPEEVVFSLSDLMGDDPIWKDNYRKHSGAGRAFYNRLEALKFRFDRWQIERVNGEVQRYKKCNNFDKREVT